MADTNVGSWYQATKRDTAGVSTGKVSDEPLTFTMTNVTTAGGASTALLTASTGITRTVTLSILAAADTGVYINAGAAATSANYLIQPGGSLTITTLQVLNGIRAGSAEVVVYIASGVKS